MATWRQLLPSDLDAVMAVGDIVHADLPESKQVFEERLQLWPQGCLALVVDDSKSNQLKLCGYAISHPIRQRQPPALDSFLAEIAADADQYYIHDVAILLGYRGQQLARRGVERLLSVAGDKGYKSVCLVSVYGTTEFWGRFGFEADGKDDEGMKKKLSAYGDDATFMVRRMA